MLSLLSVCAIHSMRQFLKKPTHGVPRRGRNIVNSSQILPLFGVWMFANPCLHVCVFACVCESVLYAGCFVLLTFVLTLFVHTADVGAVAAELFIMCQRTAVKATRNGI